MPHELPALPYDKAALEPTIDATTMEIHHGRHHKAYVDNLNKALEGHADLQNQRIEDLLRGVNKVPENIRTRFANTAAGHPTHSLFGKFWGRAPGARR